MCTGFIYNSTHIYRAWMSYILGILYGLNIKNTWNKQGDLRFLWKKKWLPIPYVCVCVITTVCIVLDNLCSCLTWLWISSCFIIIHAVDDGMMRQAANEKGFKSIAEHLHHLTYESPQCCRIMYHHYKKVWVYVYTLHRLVYLCL